VVKLRRRTWLSGIILVIPLILVLVVLVGYPLVELFFYSFHDMRYLKPNPKFIAFDNYIDVLTSPIFWTAMKNTLIWTFSSVVLAFALGLVAALALNEKAPLTPIAKVSAILPWLIPYPAVAVMWRFGFMSPFGFFDVILNYFGLTVKGGVLSNIPGAMIGVILTNVWKHYPFIMLMILAGLGQIPTELYESAHIDGANSLERFRYITFPLLKPIVIISLIIFTMWSMNGMVIVYIMTEGGPGYYTELNSLYVWRNAFQNFDFGIASAAATINLCIGIVIAFVYLIFYRKYVW
jgi:multiple sugar transport system permease protein